MGMTADQTAAIMGAHTLGNMEVDNSGYNGPWMTAKSDQTSFDNKYYQNMLNSNYTYGGNVSTDNSLPGCLGIIVTCICTVLLYFCCDKRQIWLFFKEIVSLLYFAYLSP